MRIIPVLTLAAVLAALLAAAAPVQAAGLSEKELAEAATELAQKYDETYGRRDAAGMAALYAVDGTLVSPAGPLVRGRDKLKSYYEGRFATGARDHATRISEVRVLGEAGYGFGTFSVNVPEAGGKLRRISGNITDIYTRASDGWHLQAVIPSTLPPSSLPSK